ncbi:GNAT family N-acetyltransferase [Chitinophaga rhizophila]|uniref:Acetyltransferase n=1 Tax=Chitinophaga rhizophila TaxID=2866212 RepID=A0ABS7G680_9BACT|nr:GNAT family N-acetyltransferase [Chitinophaga rhizophila]MBW8683155.1 acetyltransferase [Chitinophaga rhizophila]
MDTNLLTAIINSYCRGFSNWSCYEGIPRYDKALADYFSVTGYQFHLRLDFSANGMDVFIPLRYFSESGYHVFDFPAIERTISNDQITALDAAGLIKIIAAHLQDTYPAINLGTILGKLTAFPCPPQVEEVGIEEFNRLLSVTEIDRQPEPAEWLVNQLLPLIAALGYRQQADETALLSLVYKQYEQVLPNHSLIKDNKLSVRNELLSFMLGEEHVTRPYPNPLHKYFYSQALIQPAGKEAVYSRYFPKEDITVSIRPFDISRDLEMVHDWFNRDHAKKIWKMDWPLRELELYYRCLLPGNWSYSFIGEINGTPTYNFEVYWVVRDILSDYYDALPSDYGTHQFIAPVDPKLKFSSPSTQCMLDWVFAQPEVGKMVGEGSVESLAALMNKAHVGFRVEKVIQLPHKKANLNFCYREWYWAKFPANQHISIHTATSTIKQAHHEALSGI